jgi:transcription elongation regulator 1
MYFYFELPDVFKHFYYLVWDVLNFYISCGNVSSFFQDIDQHTDYRAFKKKWGNDLRFEAIERKEREGLLNERVLSLKRSAEQKAQEIRAAAASDFKTMLREREISINSHWSKVKDSLRNEPRYRSVAHEDREVFYYEYIAELKAAQRGDDHEMKARDEEVN